MTKTVVPACPFSAERRQDLVRLGVTVAQIAEIERVLPICRVLIEDHSPLTDARDELDKLIAALRAAQRILKPPTKAAREALNRWQMAAYSLGHPMGSDPDFFAALDLDILIDAAREGRRSLGPDQRRSHAAHPEPIRLINDALVRGWAMEHANKFPVWYRKRPRKFREIVQIAYEAIGAERDYVPEKALRAYSAWLKKEAAARAGTLEAIRAERQAGA
jgi:hypothetical protein